MYSLLFWVAMVVVLFEFLSSFIMKLDQMNERMVLDQLYFNLYLVGIFLAPALGIIAGRILVVKESEILLAHQLSRRAFQIASFLFYGLLLALVWLILVSCYVIVSHYNNQPITTDLIIKLLLSLFALLLPFLWAGLLAINVRPAAVIILYLVLFASLPRIVVQIDKPNNTASGKAITAVLKAVTVVVPQTQPYQLITSSFSSSANSPVGSWLGYGLLWTAFLILSAFLVYQRKDLADPHS
jgi:hypothetical protein